MKRFCILSLLTLAAAALASDPSTAPPSPPVTATSAPAAAKPTTSTAPAVSPGVMKILQAMEETGKKHATITADIDYHLNKTLVGDTQARTGNVAFSRETPKQAARFRVHFATLKRGDGKAAAVRVDYAFDGTWLSKADYGLRQITR